MKKRVTRRLNRSGAVELPLLLLLTLVVIGLALPSVFAMLTVYSSIDAHSKAQNGIDSIFARARQAYQGGNGTSFTVEVDFSGMFFKAIERIQVGDSVGGEDSHIARYTVSGEPERVLVIEGESPPPLTNARNESLKLSDGRYDLVVQHWILGGVSVVVVDREGAQVDVTCFG